MNGIKYDTEKLSKAGKGAALRAVVAIYIAYLAFKIFFAENTSMSVTVSRIIGAIFMAADIAFIIYTYNQFHKEMKAAALADEAPETDAEENDE
ncbi:MAG: hypothetical protein IKW96_13205 [Ruminococcus sp.]|uniref:hypothetical protein n=1 Tax=Ruminococcus sp. TaxID=41978 RepID=UPI0025E33E82|nr:hypothetical protein [Ruminococcus sp.]MBR5684206.1 hypothetical protein [Ruminococcus sp.]